MTSLVTLSAAALRSDSQQGEDVSHSSLREWRAGSPTPWRMREAWFGNILPFTGSNHLSLKNNG